MKAFLLAALAAFGLFTATPALSAATVNAPAPDFTGTDSNGVTHSLSQYKGKTVVLEWHNHDCPFVRKHYDSGNMQKLQQKWTADGFVWLTIVSSAEGKQGFLSPEETNTLMEKQGQHATARILDPSGAIGNLYGAKTTPHMFVIDGAGTVVYAGAIDSDSSHSPESLAGATNYVDAALQSIKDGSPVAVNSSQPYGCSVKY